MNQRYQLSEMMQRFVQQTGAFFPADIVSQGVEAQRQAYDRMAAFFSGPRPKSLQVSDELLGNIQVRRYQPAKIAARQPVLFVHGGGWYLGSLDSHDDFCASLAHDCRTEVISVDYRLAPEHPFPAGLDDLTAVYLELTRQGVSPLLVGDSAGGNLVAALTLRCRQDGLATALGQVLIYPALAAPDSTDSAHSLKDAPLLDRDSMRFCWQVYRGEQPVNPELCPLLARGLADLPEAAIFAAEYDPLRDEARLYAERLKQDGVRTHFQQIRGMVHGGLRAVSRTEEGDQLYYAICEQVQRLLRKST